jgi:DNA-binding NtrC family response regulator
MSVSILVVEDEPDMPGMDGLALLLREIKQRRPDLPVMMVTAYGDDKRCPQATEYRALQFLAKPVDFNLLKQEGTVNLSAVVSRLTGQGGWRFTS